MAPSSLGGPTNTSTISFSLEQLPSLGITHLPGSFASLTSKAPLRSLHLSDGTILFPISPDAHPPTASHTCDRVVLQRSQLSSHQLFHIVTLGSKRGTSSINTTRTAPKPINPLCYNCSVLARKSVPSASTAALVCSGAEATSSTAGHQPGMK